MGVIKDLQDQLLAVMDAKVKEYGFVSRPRDQAFIKKTYFGRLALHIMFAKFGDVVDASADVAIRFDALEDLVNEGLSYLSAKEKKQTYSLGAELGHLEGINLRSWRIASSANIESVAESITQTFLKVGIPYLERYSNMEFALQALSGDDREAWLHSPFHDARAKRALGLAYLLGNSQKFHQLALAKTDYLKSRNDEGLSSFLEFRDKLDSQLAD